MWITKCAFSHAYFKMCILESVVSARTLKYVYLQVHFEVNTHLILHNLKCACFKLFVFEGV